METIYMLTLKNNKNYFNQQHQQLVSYLSLRFERFFQQHCKAPQKAGGFFGDPAGNQLPAALKESHVSLNRYINPKKTERVFRVFRGYNVIKIPKIP